MFDGFNEVKLDPDPTNLFAVIIPDGLLILTLAIIPEDIFDGLIWVIWDPIPTNLDAVIIPLATIFPLELIPTPVPLVPEAFKVLPIWTL